MENDEDLLRLAIAYRAHLRLRERAICRQASCKPAWSTLLELLIAQLSKETMHIRTLTRAARIKDTTALRWIDWLRDHQLIERHSDPHNRLRVIIRLSVEGRKVVKAMLLDMGDRLNGLQQVADPDLTWTTRRP